MRHRTRSGCGGDPTMGVAVLCLVLCAMVADVHAMITIKAAPGSAAPQIVILGGGPARPTATDDGRKLPTSLKRYACTSLDGPACGETSTSGSGATTISGAELQKLFAEAIARAALDSVAKALGSAERDTTLSEEATIAKPAGSEPPMTGTQVHAAAPADAANSGGVVASSGGDAAAGSGTALDAAATLKTTTVKQTDDATGVTTTSSSTSATTASGHTIQTQIQIQSEGATGVLSADQREALFRQINEQVGSLFAQQQHGAGGVPADGVEAHVQSFAFMIPEAGGADDVEAGGVDGVAEVEIVDTGLLFGDDDELLLEHAEQMFDSGIAAANGAAPLRTGVGAGAAGSRRPPPPQPPQQPQRVAAAGPGPTSTAADAPPNSASRARSSKAVDLAPDRTVAAPGAGAGTAADDRAKAKAKAKAKASASANAQQSGAVASQRPRGAAQTALHEATLTGPQLTELRSRSASGSVGPAARAPGTAAATATKAGAKAPGAATSKAAAAAAPKAAAPAKAATAAAVTDEAEALDDSKSHILQLFERFQKQTEQQQKRPQQQPSKAPPKPAAAATAAPKPAAAAGAAAAAPVPQRRP